MSVLVGAASPGSSTALTPLRRSLSKSAEVPMLLKSLLASGTTQASTEGKASDGVDFLGQNGAF